MAGSDATASFAMDLGIKGADAAGNAADELQKLQDQIKGSEDALGGMQKALRLLKGDAKGNEAAITSLKVQIAGARKGVASATADYLKLGGSFKKAKPEIQESVSQFTKLKSVLKGSWMQVAAVVGFTAAIAVAGAATAKFALDSADARRSEELQLEGLTKLRYGYYGMAGMFGLAADKASFLQTTLDKVSSNVAIGRTEVAGYEQQLYKMGLRSGNLQAALEGASIVASAQGDAAAQSFIGMAVGAGMAGGSIRKFADDAKARLGGIVARQMLSLDVQTKKLHENFNFLFGGVKIEGFLKGLNEVTQLFSANTESGKALKTIIETIFNPFFEQGPKAGHTVKRAIQMMIIATQDFIIALYPVRKAMHDAFDPKGPGAAQKAVDSLTGKIKDWARAQSGLSGNQIDGIAIAFQGLNEAVNIVYYGLNAVINLIGDSFIDVGGNILSALGWIGNAIKGWYKTIFIDADWAGAGHAIVQGIANGIKSGAHWALEAVENLGSSVLKAFKDKLGIHSPSRVFQFEAKYISIGAAKGIDDGAPEVRRAVGRMAPDPSEMTQPGAPSPAAAAPAAESAGRSGPVIGELHLHTNEKTSEGQASDFARRFLIEVQKAGLQMGIPS